MFYYANITELQNRCRGLWVWLTTPSVHL